MTCSDFLEFLQLLAQREQTNAHLRAVWNPHEDTAFLPTSPTPTLYGILIWGNKAGQSESFKAQFNDYKAQRGCYIQSPRK